MFKVLIIEAVFAMIRIENGKSEDKLHHVPDGNTCQNKKLKNLSKLKSQCLFSPLAVTQLIECSDYIKRNSVVQFNSLWNRCCYFSFVNIIRFLILNLSLFNFFEVQLIIM